ncbi:MAG: hypothetical protein FJY85_12415 [Deltaproteobacteria bacterium]|nr:hypothetical protein [Deltaproteobacteria bacterium]
MTHTPRLFVIVGSPGSGKDLVVRAVNDLGSQHAQVVPKHTNRTRRNDDGNEMVCPGDDGHALGNCDLVYESFEDSYGIETARIWQGLEHGVFQVVVVSKVEAINKLREIFGGLLVLVYVHSEVAPEQYRRMEAQFGDHGGYLDRRTSGYRDAYEVYLANFLAFDHVLIFSGQPEDLYDQAFRLFRAYERGLLY